MLTAYCTSVSKMGGPVSQMWPAPFGHVGVGAGLCLKEGGGGGASRGSKWQLQWRLQVTHKTVEGRSLVVGGAVAGGWVASEGMRQGVV